MLGKKGDLAAKAEHISYPEFVKRMARSLRIQRKKHGMRMPCFFRCILSDRAIRFTNSG